LLKHQKAKQLKTSLFSSQSQMDQTTPKPSLQINPKTGVSSDYWNQWEGKNLAYSIGGIDLVIKNLEEFPIRTYQEIFFQHETPQPLNRKTRERILALDEIARIVNEEYKKPTEKHFKEIISVVHELVFGNPY
jgi:hypothetical protein